jgi:hypothetical protein
VHEAADDGIGLAREASHAPLDRSGPIPQLPYSITNAWRHERTGTWSRTQASLPL